jgi:hypothetical protein
MVCDKYAPHLGSFEVFAFTWWFYFAGGKNPMKSTQKINTK